MPPKRKREDDTKRLAKGLSKAQGHAKPRRTRKNPVRKIRGGDTGRAVANERELPPLARLMGALEAEKIRKCKRVFAQAVWMEWHGTKVAVLPLKLIEQSKRAIGRPKDLLHLELIRQRYEVIKRGGK